MKKKMSEQFPTSSALHNRNYINNIWCSEFNSQTNANQYCVLLKINLYAFSIALQSEQ